MPRAVGTPAALRTVCSSVKRRVGVHHDALPQAQWYASSPISSTATAAMRCSTSALPHRDWPLQRATLTGCGDVWRTGALRWLCRAEETGPPAQHSIGAQSPLQHRAVRAFSAARGANPPSERRGAAAADAFGEVGIGGDLQLALGEMGIMQPTAVQRKVIPQVLRGGDCIFTAQTGTGKTLAYLLPVIQALKAEEVESGVTARVRRPRALVVVPSRELAQQVLGVTKQLTHVAKLRSVLITGGTSRTRQRDAISSFVDLVVATPGRAAALRDEGSLFLSDVRHFVVDEADTMFTPGAGFLPDLNKLLTHRPDSGEVGEGTGPQHVLCGATTGRNASRIIKRRFPSAVTVDAADVHQTPRRLQQTFVAVHGGPRDKHDALLEAMTNNRGCPTMVFCNTIASCRSTAHFLAERGIQVASCHGGIPPHKRHDEFHAFTSGEVIVCVCTDAAARGLDKPGLEHVLNFDFPRTALDYLHRAGRTARAGQRGRVTSLVTKRDRQLATAIRQATTHGNAVVDASGAAAGASPKDARGLGVGRRPLPYVSTQRGGPLDGLPVARRRRRRGPRRHKESQSR